MEKFEPEKNEKLLDLTMQLKKIAKHFVIFSSLISISFFSFILFIVFTICSLLIKDQNIKSIFLFLAYILAFVLFIMIIFFSIILSTRRNYFYSILKNKENMKLNRKEIREIEDVKDYIRSISFLPIVNICSYKSVHLKINNLILLIETNNKNRDLDFVCDNDFKYNPYLQQN